MHKCKDESRKVKVTMNNEKKQELLEKMKHVEAIFVPMSECTKMPFVACDPESYDDEVYIFFGEEDAKKESGRIAAAKNPLRIIKIDQKFLLSFYASLLPMGVNAIVVDKGTKQEETIQLSELIRRENHETDPQGRPIVENSELQLTALYLMQKLRSQKEGNVVWTDEMRELQEEMMAHYAKGRYIVAYQEEKGLPILKQKDGTTLQPIFTDIQEFLKFQNFQQGATFKTAVFEADKIAQALAKDAIGVVVNPYSINLPLQLRQKNKTEV